MVVFKLTERDKNSEDAQKILAWIRRQEGLSFTVGDVFCAHQSRLETMGGIRPPISLPEMNYCVRPRRKEEVPYRPSEVYDVNPKELEASL